MTMAPGALPAELSQCFHLIEQPQHEGIRRAAGFTFPTKDHERTFRPANVRKRIDFAVDTLKGEIPCLPAHRARCVQYHRAF
jgi:hypothetical protein